MRASAGLWAMGVLWGALWGTGSQAQEGRFQEVAPGVELATLQAPQRSPTGDSRLTVVRVDVAKRPLRFYGVGALGLSEGLTADQWSLRYGLLAVINAGMFETDYRTPTGYAKVADRELNPRWKGKYQSLLVMDPKDPTLPQARLLDPECDGDVRQVAARYRVALQSLRMIDCKGKNRWSPQPRQWSIAALASDSRGRLLFIHSRSPYSVHDFNEVLLKLGLGISRAMYLEGGPEASLRVVTPGGVVDRIGSYETGFFESDDNTRYWALPNVLAVELPPGPGSAPKR
jgi:hypothetical protein